MYAGTRRGAQSRLWTPRDLGGILCLWLDASDASTLTMSGSNVAGWRDKSGYGNSLTASGTAMPTLTTTSGVVYTTYNGTTNILTGATAGTSFPFGASPRSCFAVVNPTSGITNGSVLGYGQAAVGHNGAAYALLCNSSSSIWVTAFNIDVQTGTAGTYVPQLFSATSTGSNTSLNINGTQVATGAQALVTASFNTTRVGGGYWNAANSLWWKGGIAHVIFVNAPVNAAITARIEGYLAWKCGLQTSLPATHQYRLAPPRVSA